jgi:hypothetical protein
MLVDRFVEHIEGLHIARTINQPQLI